MKYHLLEIYKYYHHGLNDVKKEYKHRIESPIVLNTKLQFFIDGYYFPLFLMPNIQLISMTDKVYAYSSQIRTLIYKLPKIAQKEFFLGNLRREIRSTNKIEGVNTTNQEINTAITKASHNSRRMVRFQPFSRMYLRTGTEKELSIHTPSDIRKIYDNLLTGVVSKKLFPTGTIFRNGFVRIADYMGNTVYQPLAKEKEFMPFILSWIEFINDDTIPPLIKACIAHFYFESIHPFFDGNGRTGRYILCTYLSSKLDKYTAISFSQEIVRHKNRYYKAFGKLNNPVNHGEITFFVMSMLKIILSSQVGLINILQDKIQVMKGLKKHLSIRKIIGLDGMITSLLFQVQYFNQRELGMNIKQIRTDLNMTFSNYKVRKSIKGMLRKHYFTLIKEKPITVHLSDDFLNSLMGEE